MNDLKENENENLEIKNGDLVLANDLQTAEQAKKTLLLYGQGSNRFAPFLGVGLAQYKNTLRADTLKRVITEQARLDGGKANNFSLNLASGELNFELIYG